MLVCIPNGLKLGVEILLSYPVMIGIHSCYLGPGRGLYVSEPDLKVTKPKKEGGYSTPLSRHRSYMGGFIGIMEKKKETTI